MADGNHELALRIKIDVAAAARGEIDKMATSVGAVGTQTTKTSAALGPLNQRMDGLLTVAGRMAELLQSLDTRLAAVTAGSGQLAQVTQEVETATKAATASMEQQAETEAERTTRIHAMVAASREQQAAEQATSAATTRAAVSDEQRAATARETTDAIARQNAQMARVARTMADEAAASRKAAGATGMHSAELVNLLHQIDPTIKKLDELDRQQAKLGQAKRLGLIDSEDFARFNAVVEKAREPLDRAGQSMHKFSLNTAQSRRELGFLAKDIATGQWGRLTQSSFTLANYSGLTAKMMSASGLAIGGVTLAVGAFAIAVVKGYLENERLARSILVTGNYAGQTTGSIDRLAGALGGANGKSAEARTILQGLIGTGKISSETLGEVGRAAVNMAQLTGKSAKEVVAEFSKIADDPVRGAIELDQQYHFLNTTVLQQIQTLQKAGDQYGALQLLAKTFADETGDRMDELRARMGWLERFADNWDNNGFSRLGRWAMSLGKPTDEVEKFQAALEKYNKIYAVYQASLGTGSTKGYSDTLFAQAQQAYAELQAAQTAAREVQGQAAAEGVAKQVQSEGNAAAVRIDQLATSLDRAKQRQEALNKAAADLYKIHLAGGALPEGVNFDGPVADLPQGAGWDTLKAGIEARYADPKKGAGSSSGRDALAAAKAASAAVDQQIQDLIRVQAALDPTTKAWADYNAEVANQNKIAATAKAVAGADVAAIDARRNALVQAAEAAREADLAGIAAKDQKAWENLRQALRTPTEVRLETAMAQIAELNRLIASGTGHADQYRAMLERIGQNAVSALPSYQGVDAVVGGAAGELAKNFQAQKELETSYGEQLRELAKQLDDGKLADHTAYLAAREKLDKDHDAKTAIIEQSRQQLALATASQGFSDLAGLAKVAYGEQSKQYRIMFALSKGFAVAQAAASLGINVAKASETGFPQNIPFIIGAFAQGASIAAIIAGANFSGSGSGGYATGGEIRGPGTGTSDSILMWGSNGEFMQREAAVKYYGLDFMHAINNLQMPRYATGGPIGFANAPAAPSFAMPRAPAIAANDSSNAAQQNRMRVYVVQNEDQLAQRLAEHPAMEKRIVAVAGENGTAIRAEW